MLKSIARLLKVLNSETDPGQISLGFCFALIIGLTPLMSLHNILVIFLVCILRTNLSAFLLGFLIFTGIAYLLDPLFNRLGLVLLTADPLEPLWTSMYNLALFRLESFNNSIVMGSLVFSLALFIPLYFLFNLLIVKYRDYLLGWIEKSRLMKFFMASRFYRIYKSTSDLGGTT
ncbi:MAG: TIGR03546 family protein [Desulfurivibrionaceae bacterium]|nr:TIGR03546 family protein [Desulfurivibrionaceae bacterium]